MLQPLSKADLKDWRLAQESVEAVEPLLLGHVWMMLVRGDCYAAKEEQSSGPVP